MIFDSAVVVVSVLALGLLLFPVKVRFLFRAARNDGEFEIRLFRFKIFFSKGDEKKGDGENAPDVGSLRGENSERENFSAAPVGEKNAAPLSGGKFAGERDVQTGEPVRAETSAQKKEKPSPKKSKGKSSDSEFLLLALEPGFDKKLWKGAGRMLRSFFRIFRCRFQSTVVEGIRLDDYAEMGFLNGTLDFFSAAVPLFENWEFRMDWEGTRPLRIDGGMVASFSLARVLGFLAVSSRWVVELVWIYFKNRRRLRKNPGGFRLVLWRRLVVRFLSAS